MHPLLSVFLRLTALVTIGIIALLIAGFVLKIVLVAGLIAAAVVAGFFVYSFFRNRSSVPVIR